MPVLVTLNSFQGHVDVEKVMSVCLEIFAFSCTQSEQIFDNDLYSSEQYFCIFCDPDFIFEVMCE